jgi:capsular polysaccharide biosynthesis protein
MSRLPKVLQPAWPIAKRVHRRSTLVVGAVARRAGRVAGSRAVPRLGTESADETAALEPASVRLHHGHDGERLRRPMPIGVPADHWVFERWSEVDTARTFTLEIRDGTVVGNYAANITPGGILDGESSTYFGVSGWREHPVFLRPRLPEAIHVEGTVASLATRGSHGNYYHFLLDVLPRWGVLQESMPGVRPDHYYVNRTTRYHRQLLEMVGLGEVSTIEPTKDSAVRASTLLVPCIPNEHLVAPTWTTGWLKENLPPSTGKDLPKRLYVTRGQVKNTRRLVNEEAVMSSLARRGFVRFDPGQHSVQEQIDHFAAAEVIVAPHGAALANLTFCSPGVRVLELFAPKYVNPCYWAIASNVPDAHYRYIVCGADPRPAGSPMDGVLTDITVDESVLDAVLEDLLADDPLRPADELRSAPGDS